MDKQEEKHKHVEWYESLRERYNSMGLSVHADILTMADTIKERNAQYIFDECLRQSLDYYDQKASFLYGIRANDGSIPAKGLSKVNDNNGEVRKVLRGLLEWTKKESNGVNGYWECNINSLSIKHEIERLLEGYEKET